MNSFWDYKYVVTDVETTGSNSDKNRITEIACVVVQSGEIIHEYSSLVNPHQFIPPFISNLTGINNDMVYNAPEYGEILPKIQDILNQKNTVFVAHNVHFDWAFLQNAFWREKIHLPTLPQVCTLKIARALYPQDMKKNVGALAEYFNYPLKERHRALGDAKATALVLIEFLELLESDHGFQSLEEILHFQTKRKSNYKAKNTNYDIVKDKIDLLPQSAGIYYFKDQNDKIIYIGKSKNIRRRVNSYFTSGYTKSRKISELVKLIYDIDYIETNSELSALILEMREIKGHKPYFNRALKDNKKHPFIKLIVNDEYPRIEISTNFTNDGNEFFGPFRNKSLVENLIQIIDNNFKLVKCQFPGVHSKKEACIYYQMQKCSAPCIKVKKNEVYNLEVANVRRFLNGVSSEFIETLEAKMHELSDNLDFENAAKLRDSIKEVNVMFNHCQKVPTSLKNQSLVLVLPNDKNERTIDVFLIKNGKLEQEFTKGIKADLRDIVEGAKSIYFDGKDTLSQLNPQDMEEIRITSSWLYKNKERGEIFYIHEVNEHSFINSLDNAISEINY